MTIALLSLIGLVLFVGVVLWYGISLKPHGDREPGEHGYGPD